MFLDPFGGPGLGFGLMFNLVPLFIFGIMGFMIFSIVRERQYNRSQPRLEVKAEVISKRQNVSHHHHNNNVGTSSTSYYVTFEFETSDRKEFRVRGDEYGMLVEGDSGLLTFQGNDYQGFKRQ